MSEEFAELKTTTFSIYGWPGLVEFRGILPAATAAGG